MGGSLRCLRWLFCHHFDVLAKKLCFRVQRLLLFSIQCYEHIKVQSTLLLSLLEMGGSLRCLRWLFCHHFDVLAKKLCFRVQRTSGDLSPFVKATVPRGYTLRGGNNLAPWPVWLLIQIMIALSAYLQKGEVHNRWVNGLIVHGNVIPD